MHGIRKRVLKRDNEIKMAALLWLDNKTEC